MLLIAVFSWPGDVIVRCHHSGDGGGGRGASLQGTNVGITHPAASPAPKTHWRDVSKAWPHHSLAERDQGTPRLEKLLWQHSLLDSAF